ncbi:MAG: D-glycero-beta-D-manno-heptose 1-phosphate adenylyltransferase [Desulfobacterales bacterium]|nr:MAG: D-glycero-beta-D-manno-heptose 1-phosphate adenylyltransferase [Desulfobacterales bacterium]
MELRSTKILAAADLAEKLKAHRLGGKRVVFTNGCFDILHVGHVRYLGAASAEGDILVVGLNSDGSVRSLKGAKRPIVSQDERAEVLAALGCVDYVTIFDEADPLRLIQILQPDVLIKGGDWEEDQIIGADRVKAAGGQVRRVAVVPGASTSGIVQRILEKYR